MKKLAVWASKPYQQDRLFDAAAAVNRDDCLAGFRMLKASVEAAGGACHTSDVFKRSRLAPDVVLFLDVPALPARRLLSGWADAAKAWVVLQEPPVVAPRNWDRSLHGQFERLFTWDPSLASGGRYVRLEFMCPFAPFAGKAPAKEKLCVMIAGNKKSSHPLELYSAREETLRWFERHHPEDLDLYGIGWDRYAFGGPRPLRALNRLGSLTRLLAPERPLYRGPVERKIPLLSRYKFSVCYENARDVPGFVTEKIFDSLSAGCVPVYWGAPDIERHVPQGCFVDRRAFRTHEELYERLAGMPDEEYAGMLSQAAAFLASERAYPHSPRCFSETLSGALA